MNYATLFETIKGYVENDFPNTSFSDSTGSGTATLTSKEQIDTFIQQAEQRIYNTAQILDLRKSATNTIVAGVQYFSLPTDWLATYSLATVDSGGSYNFLLNKDVNYIREAFPSPSVTGAPTHYALFDDATMLLGPTPDATYTLQLHYFYYPETIVTAGNTWLGDNFDSVLLYGSLLEAYVYMKGEPDVIQMYQQRYEEAMMLLKQLSEGKNRKDMYRTGQLRRPVN